MTIICLAATTSVFGTLNGTGISGGWLNTSSLLSCLSRAWHYVLATLSISYKVGVFLSSVLLWEWKKLLGIWLLEGGVPAECAGNGLWGNFTRYDFKVLSDNSFSSWFFFSFSSLATVPTVAFLVFPSFLTFNNYILLSRHLMMISNMEWYPAEEELRSLFP